MGSNEVKAERPWYTGPEDKPYGMRVAGYLRSMRLQAGLTQGELAERLTRALGRTLVHQDVSKYERGFQTPRSDVSFAWGDVCGAPIDHNIDLQAMPAARVARVEKKVAELRRLLGPTRD